MLWSVVVFGPAAGCFALVLQNGASTHRTFCIWTAQCPFEYAFVVEIVAATCNLPTGQQLFAADRTHLRRVRNSWLNAFANLRFQILQVVVAHGLG